ncbi:MAG TPA: tetratricopeptide repeat protein [Bacillota bacterium]|nr:tetratricopeptide repeat protein [Bacillota bacterium]
MNLYDQIDDALLHIRNGEVEEGLSILNTVVAYSENDPQVMFELSNVFYDLGHLDTAKSLLEKMDPFLDELTTSELVEFRTFRAELRIDEGQLDEALEELIECLELESNYTRAAILLADIYLMQNLPEIACRYLEDILQDDPDQPDVRYILAEIYIEENEWEKAEDHLGYLVGTEYEDKAKLSQAKLLSKYGSFEQAHELFLDTLSTNPIAEGYLGCSLTALQLGHLEQAVFYGTKLLELEPDHIGAYQVVSSALEKMGKLEKAKELLEHAFQMNDQEEAINLKLIEICYQLGDKIQASQYLQHFIDCHEETEEATRWKESLTIQ